MSTMNVSLPEELKSYVDEQVGGGGYGSTSEYVRDLIRRDKDRQQLRHATWTERRRNPVRSPTRRISRSCATASDRTPDNRGRGRSDSASARRLTLTEPPTTTCARPGAQFLCDSSTPSNGRSAKSVTHHSRAACDSPTSWRFPICASDLWLVSRTWCSTSSGMTPWMYGACSTPGETFLSAIADEVDH
jgi:putative addiction module CopG family antidote